MKWRELNAITTQIVRLRARMGDETSPPDEIKRGYYPDGSKIRPEVHLKRVQRLKKLEKRAGEIVESDMNRWFRRVYRL